MEVEGHDWTGLTGLEDGCAASCNGNRHDPDLGVGVVCDADVGSWSGGDVAVAVDGSEVGSGQCSVSCDGVSSKRGGIGSAAVEACRTVFVVMGEVDR